MFRNNKLEGRYKPARYHILTAVRILANREPMPTTDKFNSREMKRYAEVIITKLQDTAQSDGLLTRAVMVVDAVADDKYDNDNVRTELFTQKVLEEAQEIANATETA